MNKQDDKKTLVKVENHPIGNLTEEEIRILVLENTQNFDDKFCMEDLIVMKRGKYVCFGLRIKK